MADEIVVAIFISPIAGGPMQPVEEVEALAGKGLKGDRYARGEGSFNQGALGTRQVTFINAVFFEGSGFEYVDSRRNIVTKNVELMWLIGRGEFAIGNDGARFKAVKYCDPCTRPNKLGGEKLAGARLFKDAFHDRGGLIAQVIHGGIIRAGDKIILPPKGY